MGSIPFLYLYFTLKVKLKKVNLVELFPIVFYMELTHLGSEVPILFYRKHLPKIPLFEVEFL